uniref:PUM-HD domain-containing protein n=1 Tax=Strigamia maritima TaxID=126957 RepID=T1J1K3_STRMM
MTTKRKSKTTQDGSPSKIKKFDNATEAASEPKPLKSALKHKKPVISETTSKKAVEFSPNTEEEKTNLYKISDKSKSIKKEKSKPKFGNKSKDSESKSKVPAKKKERKAFYKAAKNNYEIITKAKQVWERFRNTKNKEKVPENADELYSLIKGHTVQLVYAHDTSRVIECLMSLGPEHIKDAVYDELKDEIVKMSQSKYAKFFVLSLLKYGKKEQKSQVITLLTKDVVRLMKHTEAAAVVEASFNEHASTGQRKLMIEPFYGSYKLYKLDGDQSFAEIMKDPIKRQVILEFMKKTLLDIVEKSVIYYSLIHKVLLDYLEYCDETDRNEMIDTIKLSVVQILHTRDGSRVALKCIWNGSAKIRKLIIKSFKMNVTKICKEKQGHLVLLAIFDCLDDTELVKKIIISEIITNFRDIIFDPEGKKVVIYLLAGRDTDYISPGIIDILKEGDANSISKKDKPTRQKELLAGIAPTIANFFIQNPRELLFNVNTVHIAQSVLRFIPEFRNKTLDTVVSITSEPFSADDKTSSHIIDNSIGHSFLKKLLKYDKMSRDKSGDLFCEKLMSVIEPNNFFDWINCNRGTFIIISLIETGIESVVLKLKKILKPAQKTLAQKTFTGAQILLKKLKNKDE